MEQTDEESSHFGYDIVHYSKEKYIENHPYKSNVQRVGGFRQRRRKAVFGVVPVGDNQAWICTRQPSLELIDIQGNIIRSIALPFISALFGGVLSGDPVCSHLGEIFIIKQDDEIEKFATFESSAIECLHIPNCTEEVFTVLKRHSNSYCFGWRELLRLSKTGDVLQSLNSNLQNELILEKPRFVASFPDGRLCVVDKNYVKVLDHCGENLLVRSKLPKGEIWNVAVDNFDNIIFSCGLTGLIKLVSIDGSVLQTYNIKESLNEGLISVWSTMADDLNRLWIGAFSGDVLVVNYLDTDNI